MIRLKNVSKYYYSNNIVASGISKINLELKIGEFVAITGESGSGKSTLLNVISGLDSYEDGEMFINNEETSHFNEKDYEDYRRKYIGNIFQNFNLINSYTVYQNIELIMLLNGARKKDVKEKVLELIKTVNLTKFKNSKVSKLSGGQKQRVAIARALANNSPIIIADEPTGNLDSKSAKDVIEVLHKISKNKLVVIVTHNYDQIEEYVTRKIRMNDGKILEDKIFTKTEEVVPEVLETKNIRTISKMKLMFRNTFNVIPKFLLLFLVFSLLTVAVISKYSFDRKQEDLLYENGYNYYFRDTSPERIIIKKDNNAEITKNDIEEIKNIEHVNTVVENDFIIDNSFGLNDRENIYFHGMIKSVDNIGFSELSYGKMPENDNEIVLSVDPYFHYEDISNLVGETVYSDFEYYFNYIGELKIVGVIKSNGYESTFYASDELLNKMNVASKFSYDTSLITPTIDGIKNVGMYYSINFIDTLQKGEILVDETFCYDCKNKTINLEYSNNVTRSKDFIVKAMVNEQNYDDYGIEMYQHGASKIYMNIDDFNELVEEGNNQSSIYVDDINNLEVVNNSLEKLGYNTFIMKDSVITEDVIVVINNVITVIMLVVLFFISYFVVKLIYRSRNVYFSTIRILGANKKVAKDLLNGELFILSSFTYWGFVLIVNLIDSNSSFILNIKRYMNIPNYLIVYLLLIIMSYLIGIRYSSKLFKNSVIKTLNEEGQ